MKRLIAATLVFAVLSSGLCYAANPTQTGSTIQVSLDTIENVWTNHSPDLAKIKSDLSISRRAFEDMEDALDRANDRMDSSMATLNSHDQAKLAYDIASAQCTQKVKNAILDTKKSFLCFWQDQLNLNYTVAKLSQKQDQLTKYSGALKQGYLSQKTYDELENAVIDLETSIDSLRLKVMMDESTLKTKLGLSQDSKLEYIYPALSEEMFITLMKMDPKADLESLQKNSVNLKVLQLTYESLLRYTRSYANGYQVEGAELNLKTAQENLPINYSVQYQQLINQYKDLQNDYRKVELQKQKLSKVHKQYDKGFASAVSLANLELEYSLAESGVKVKESVLYSNYLSYLNMVSGN